MTLVQTEPKKIYLGNNELKAVYLGDTKIRPTIKDFFADFILVGGGGAGGGNNFCTSEYGTAHNGGGGGGEVVLGSCLPIENSMCIIVGLGGVGAKASGEGNDGTASCIGDLYKANGGFGGEMYIGTQNNIRAISGGRSGVGYNGGCGCYNDSNGGGGGGAGGNGLNGASSGGGGGAGICGYGGGGGGNCNGSGQGGGGDGGDNRYASCPSKYPGWSGCPATNCGGGGGGAGVRRYCSSGSSKRVCMRGAGRGGDGVVEICYPSDGSYGYSNATGGDCCYTCDGYCVHRFTSNGKFTIG